MYSIYSNTVQGRKTNEKLPSLNSQVLLHFSDA